MAQFIAPYFEDRVTLRKQLLSQMDELARNDYINEFWEVA